LAAKVKIELVAELLQSKLHEVEIMSQGEVIERKLKVYPAFFDAQPFSPTIPVHYSSSLPVRHVNGLWASVGMLRFFLRRHKASLFDVVLVYNLKLPQLVCAFYAARYLRLPVILQYEDDVFVDVSGKSESGLTAKCYRYLYKALLRAISGAICVSPHLISQMPAAIPKLLLRGMVDDDCLASSGHSGSPRNNWIVFSGTHFRTKGLKQLITAWRRIDVSGWQLHIAGGGELTAELEEMAEGDESIVFHGVLDRQQNARFVSSAKIGINPHDLSETPGNVFAFKIVEYLACGLHVITTPMGALEPELEEGITYMTDNSPDVIAATIRKVIEERSYNCTAEAAARKAYGATTISKSLDELVRGLVRPRATTPSTTKGSALADRCIG